MRDRAPHQPSSTNQQQQPNQATLTSSTSPQQQQPPLPQSATIATTTPTATTATASSLRVRSSALFWYQHWSTLLLHTSSSITLVLLAVISKQSVYGLLLVGQLLFPWVRLVPRQVPAAAAPPLQQPLEGTQGGGAKNGRDEENDKDEQHKHKILLLVNRPTTSRIWTWIVLIHVSLTAICGILVASVPMLQEAYHTYSPLFHAVGIWNPSSHWAAYGAQLVLQLLHCGITYMLAKRTYRIAKSEVKDLALIAKAANAFGQGGGNLANNGTAMSVVISRPTAVVAGGVDGVHGGLNTATSRGRSLVTENTQTTTASSGSYGQFARLKVLSPPDPIIGPEELRGSGNRLTPGRTSILSLMTLLVAMLSPSYVTAVFLFLHVALLGTMLLPRSAPVKWVLLYGCSVGTLLGSCLWITTVSIMLFPILGFFATGGQTDTVESHGKTLPLDAWLYVLGPSALPAFPAPLNSSLASSTAATPPPYSPFDSIDTPSLDMSVSFWLVGSTLAALVAATTARANLGIWTVPFRWDDAVVEARKALAREHIVQRAKALRLVQQFATSGGSRAVAAQREKAVRFVCRYFGLILIPLMWVVGCAIVNALSFVLVCVTFAALTLETRTFMRVVPLLYLASAAIAIITYLALLTRETQHISNHYSSNSTSSGNMSSDTDIGMGWVDVLSDALFNEPQGTAFTHVMIELGIQLLSMSVLILARVVHKRAPTTSSYYYSREKRYHVRKAFTLMVDEVSDLKQAFLGMVIRSNSTTNNNSSNTPPPPPPLPQTTTTGVITPATAAIVPPVLLHADEGNALIRDVTMFHAVMLRAGERHGLLPLVQLLTMNEVRDAWMCFVSGANLLFQRHGHNGERLRRYLAFMNHAASSTSLTSAAAATDSTTGHTMQQPRQQQMQSDINNPSSVAAATRSLARFLEADARDVAASFSRATHSTKEQPKTTTTASVNHYYRLSVQSNRSNNNNPNSTSAIHAPIPTTTTNGVAPPSDLAPEGSDDHHEEDFDLLLLEQQIFGYLYNSGGGGNYNQGAAAMNDDSNNNNRNLHNGDSSNSAASFLIAKEDHIGTRTEDAFSASSWHPHRTTSSVAGDEDDDHRRDSGMGAVEMTTLSTSVINSALIITEKTPHQIGLTATASVAAVVAPDSTLHGAFSFIDFMVLENFLRKFKEQYDTLHPSSINLEERRSVVDDMNNAVLPPTPAAAGVANSTAAQQTTTTSTSTLDSIYTWVSLVVEVLARHARTFALLGMFFAAVAENDLDLEQLVYVVLFCLLLCFPVKLRRLWIVTSVYAAAHIATLYVFDLAYRNASDVVRRNLEANTAIRVSGIAVTDPWRTSVYLFVLACSVLDYRLGRRKVQSFDDLCVAVQWRALLQSRPVAWVTYHLFLGLGAVTFLLVVILQNRCALVAGYIVVFLVSSALGARSAATRSNPVITAAMQRVGWVQAGYSIFALLFASTFHVYGAQEWAQKLLIAWAPNSCGPTAGSPNNVQCLAEVGVVDANDMILFRSLGIWYVASVVNLAIVRCARDWKKAQHRYRASSINSTTSRINVTSTTPGTAPSVGGAVIIDNDDAEFFNTFLVELHHIELKLYDQRVHTALRLTRGLCIGMMEIRRVIAHNARQLLWFFLCIAGLYQRTCTHLSFLMLYIADLRGIWVIALSCVAMGQVYLYPLFFIPELPLAVDFAAFLGFRKSPDVLTTTTTRSNFRGDMVEFVPLVGCILCAVAETALATAAAAAGATRRHQTAAVSPQLQQAIREDNDDDATEMQQPLLQEAASTTLPRKRSTPAPPTAIPVTTQASDPNEAEQQVNANIVTSTHNERHHTHRQAKKGFQRHLATFGHYMIQHFWSDCSFEILSILLIATIGVGIERATAPLAYIALGVVVMVGRAFFATSSLCLHIFQFYIAVCIVSLTLLRIGLPKSLIDASPFNDSDCDAWALYLGCSTPIADIALLLTCFAAGRLMIEDIPVTLSRRIVVDGHVTFGSFLKSRAKMLAYLMAVNAPSIDGIIPAPPYALTRYPRSIQESFVMVIVFVPPTAMLAFFDGAVAPSIFGILDIIVGLLLLAFKQRVVWRFYAFWPRVLQYLFFRAALQLVLHLPVVRDALRGSPSITKNIGIVPWYDASTAAPLVLFLLTLIFALIQHRIFNEFFFAGELIAMHSKLLLAAGKHAKMIRFMETDAIHQQLMVQEQEDAIRAKLDELRKERASLMAYATRGADDEEVGGAAVAVGVAQGGGGAVNDAQLEYDVDEEGLRNTTHSSSGDRLVAIHSQPTGNYSAVMEQEDSTDSAALLASTRNRMQSTVMAPSTRRSMIGGDQDNNISEVVVPPVASSTLVPPLVMLRRAGMRVKNAQFLRITTSAQTPRPQVDAQQQQQQLQTTTSLSAPPVVATAVSDDGSLLRADSVVLSIPHSEAPALAVTHDDGELTEQQPIIAYAAADSIQLEAAVEEEEDMDACNDNGDHEGEHVGSQQQPQQATNTSITRQRSETHHSTSTRLQAGGRAAADEEGEVIKRRSDTWHTYYDAKAKRPWGSTNNNQQSGGGGNSIGAARTNDEQEDAQEEVEEEDANIADHGPSGPLVGMGRQTSHGVVGLAAFSFLLEPIVSSSKRNVLVTDVEGGVQQTQQRQRARSLLQQQRSLSEDGRLSDRSGGPTPTTSNNNKRSPSSGTPNLSPSNPTTAATKLDINGSTPTPIKANSANGKKTAKNKKKDSVYHRVQVWFADLQLDMSVKCEELIRYFTTRTYSGKPPPSDSTAVLRLLSVMFRVLIRNSQHICFALFAINFAVSATVVDLLLLMSAICYAMTVSPWADALFWDAVLLYKCVVIVMKAIADTIIDESETPLNTQRWVSMLILNTGLWEPEGSAARDHASVVDLALSFVVFAAVLLHRQWCIDRGVFGSSPLYVFHDISDAGSAAATAALEQQQSIGGGGFGSLVLQPTILGGAAASSVQGEGDLITVVTSANILAPPLTSTSTSIPGLDVTTTGGENRKKSRVLPTYDSVQTFTRHVWSNWLTRRGAGEDYYALYVSTHVLFLVLFIIMYYPLSGQLRGSIVESINQDLVPGAAVVIVFALVLVMFAERVVYITGSIRLKVLLHIAMFLLYSTSYLAWNIVVDVAHRFICVGVVLP